MKNNIIKTLVLFFLIGSLYSCNLFSDPIKPVENKIDIKTGDFVQVASANIGSGGGNVNVTSGNLTGLSINIPKNAFTETRTIKVSTAEITSASLGKYVNPITPVIKIENGGGYANNIIKIKIPIQLPSGHFPMGFFIDETNNKLEPIPIIDYDQSSITVATRHFSTSTISQGTKQLRTRLFDSYTKLLISSISESILNAQTVINSGFNVGVDDWEFVNFGSYISPPGHCAGQSLAAMWYFYEKKLKNSPALFHQFDKINTKTQPAVMWQDNPLGYRFSSVIQEDFKWTKWSEEMDFRSKYPSISWKAFAAAMLVTGEPQSVLIRNSQGKGGHAMIVYKVNMAEKKLYIADPNYPNNISPSDNAVSIRTIDYVNDKFNPYFTGLNAQDSTSIEMDQISYFAKTAYIDWEQLGKRWKEVENQTIGSIAPNAFPSYTIWDEKGFEVTNEMILGTDSLNVKVISPDAELFYNDKNIHVIGLHVYDQNGKMVGIENNKNYNVKVKLKEGSNVFGFYVFGWRKSAKYKNGKYIDQFVDFKWLNITYTKPTMKVFDGSGFMDAQMDTYAERNGVPQQAWTKIGNFGHYFDPKTISEVNGVVTGTFLNKPNISYKLVYNPKTFELTSFSYIIKTTTPSGYIDEESLSLVNIPSKYFQKTETTNYVNYNWSVKGTELSNYIVEAKKHWTNKDSYGFYEEWMRKMVSSPQNALNIELTFAKIK